MTKFRQTYLTDLKYTEWMQIMDFFPDSHLRRPRTWELWQIINTILYVVRRGCQWRMLPKDFAPWQTVYGYFRRWKRQGLWVRMNAVLVKKVRGKPGRHPKPSAVIIDSQSVKTPAGGEQRGVDVHKQTPGRKRHIIVDTLGLLWMVLVHSASIQEARGGHPSLQKLFDQIKHSVHNGWCRLKLIWADGAYASIVAEARQQFGWTLEIVRRSDQAKGFEISPHRWIVERTFSWLGRDRRLSRDFEHTVTSSESKVYIASIRRMLYLTTKKHSLSGFVGDGWFQFKILPISRNLSPFLCIALYASFAISLASCSTPSALPTSINPAPTGAALVLKSTPVPTATATLIPIPARAQYQINVVLDYAAKSISVDETLVYPNHTGQALNDLLLAVEPNLWPNCFTLGSLAVNGVPITNYALDGQKFSFALGSPLAPETTLKLQIQYSIILPQIEQTNPNLSRPRIFGFTQRQINLTNWYPFIVPNVAGQWVLHDPWYYGEHLVYDAADYVVNVKSADPAVTPILASSGAPSQNGASTTYTLASGRAFVMSASTEFQTTSIQVGNAVVTSYYFPPYDVAGKAALNASAQALQIYSQRYGPYSHQTLAVVMGDFNDGMEFSGFFFLSRGFYNLYDGTLNNFLIDVAAHETAHQWWFEQVADDQALQPWLDEAMATYSEHIFYESVSPASLQQWWWPVRIDLTQPQGWVDTSIYNAGGNPQYWMSVYFRGAHFLDALRTRIGDQAYFAFLQDYLNQENGNISSSVDFFRILRLHTQVDFSDLLKQYFQTVY